MCQGGSDWAIVDSHKRGRFLYKVVEHVNRDTQEMPCNADSILAERSDYPLSTIR